MRAYGVIPQPAAVLEAQQVEHHDLAAGVLLEEALEVLAGRVDAHGGDSMPPAATTSALAQVASARSTSSSRHAGEPRVVEVDRDACRASASSSPRLARPLPRPRAHRSPAAASSAWRVRRSRRAPVSSSRSLLERVDAHLRVAADREPHAGVAVGQRGQVAVAEVALGGRAGHDDRAATRRAGRRRPRSTWMPWTTLVRGPRKPVRSQQLDRRAAVLGRGTRRARARCSWRVHVADEAVRVGVARRSPRASRRHGADAVRGDADAHARRGRAAQARSASTRARNASTSGRRSAAGRGAAGGRRRPSRRGGRRRAAARSRSPASRAASATRDAPSRSGPRTACRRAVVDVVELADRAVARGAPSRRRRAAATSRIDVRVERAGQREHRLAPAPEVVGGVRLGRRAARRRRAGRAGTRASARWASRATRERRGVTRAASSARRGSAVAADRGVGERRRPPPARG